MLTLPKIDVVRDNREAYRPYHTTISWLTQISPNFTRVTFTTPEFKNISTAGLDQRIKLVIPYNTEQGWHNNYDHLQLQQNWYQQWQKTPTQQRNPLRTYTIRQVRPNQAEIDVDFVNHQTQGPASIWLKNAKIGNKMLIIGPDNRSKNWQSGTNWQPNTAKQVLLVGDETATPAICAILESLNKTITAEAFIEIPHKKDIPQLTTHPNCKITWLPRANEPHGKKLTNNITKWAQNTPPTTKQNHFYAWLAGETSTVTNIRRFLIKECSLNKNTIDFMGYWRKGKAETN